MAKKAAEKDTEDDEKPAAAPAPAGAGYASLPVAYAASLQQHYAQHASQSTQQAPTDANARAYQSYQVAQYNAALAASQPPPSKPKGKDANNPHQRHGRWTEEEHTQFLSLMTKYGRSWTKISQCMRTRSEPQVRSHAQKHFLRLNRLEKAAKGEGAAPAEAQYPKPERKKQKRRKVEAPQYEQPSSDEAGVPSALLAQGVALPGPPQQPYYGQGAYPYPYMVPPQPGAAQQPYYNYLPFAAMPGDPNAAAVAPWTAATPAAPAPPPMTPEEQQRLYATDPQAYQMRILSQIAAAPGPPIGADPNSSFWFDPATGQIVCSTAPTEPIAHGTPLPAEPPVPPVKAEADAGDAN